MLNTVSVIGYIFDQEILGSYGNGYCKSLVAVTCIQPGTGSTVEFVVYNRRDEVFRSFILEDALHIYNDAL